MLRTIVAFAVLFAALLLIAACASKDNDAASAKNGGQAGDRKDPPRTPAQALMRQKLIVTQSVLEGIALEDFRRISDGAARLHEISSAADFAVHQTLAYQKFAADFRMLAEDLKKNAENRKLEATALGYMELTMTCVRCHSYLRREGLVSGDDAWLDSLARTPAR